VLRMVYQFFEIGCGASVFGIHGRGFELKCTHCL